MSIETLSRSSVLSRRRFLAGSLAAGAGVLAHRSFANDPGADAAADENKALVAITLDLEMSRNFPDWETTHWDYEKGNLNEPTKQYAVEACRRVKERGGVLHTFCVGRVCEQENVDWLKGIAQSGHPIGNHTYDHVYVRAAEPSQIQFRFQRAPWLIEGRSVPEVISQNVRLCNLALETRIGVKAAGFRTPGGFSDALDAAPDVQQMLLDQGFDWVSSKYPAHAVTKPMQMPGEDVYSSIVAAQEGAQPYRYESGLIEVPMSPISDIGAFRGGRWQLDWFLEAIRRGVSWAIEHHAVFDFLGHPSCLYVVDPEFRTVDLICDLVADAGERAALVDLGTIARRVKQRAL